MTSMTRDDACLPVNQVPLSSRAACGGTVRYYIDCEAATMAANRCSRGEARSLLDVSRALAAMRRNAHRAEVRAILAKLTPEERFTLGYPRSIEGSVWDEAADEPAHTYGRCGGAR